MAKEIKITLIQSLIINSVKNETYKRGQVVKAADEKNTTTAFHEQAGDEAYQERMIQRAMFTQVERLKTWFSDYLAGTGYLSDDPLISSEEENDTIEIILKVSDRFNDGFVKSLARLSQKYVEDRTIHLWWASTNPDLSKFYAQLAEEDLLGIRRCFNKTAPSAPTYNFPTGIQLTYPIIPDSEGVPGNITPDNSDVVEPEQLFDNPWLITRGCDSEISYTLTGENDETPIDDIIVRADDGCCQVYLQNGSWHMKGVRQGYTIITLFSRHNDQVFAKFAVRIA